MCSQANLHQLLSEVLAHAQDCFGSNLDGVILYGSHARGDADEESDVDIMILVRQPAEQMARQRREWSRFGTGLDLKYEVFTSLKLQDADTFYAWQDTLPFFRNVTKEGVRISA